jgi:hypothetical protein
MAHDVYPEITVEDVDEAWTWECDTSVNWMNNGPPYRQIDLTDYCHDGICDANPKYGEPNNDDEAVKYCQRECENRNSMDIACEGFFF